MPELTRRTLLIDLIPQKCTQDPSQFLHSISCSLYHSQWLHQLLLRALCKALDCVSLVSSWSLWSCLGLERCWHCLSYLLQFSLWCSDGFHQWAKGGAGLKLTESYMDKLCTFLCSLVKASRRPEAELQQVECRTSSGRQGGLEGKVWTL